MVNMEVKILGFFLGLLGFVGTIVCTVLPDWRSTAYVGSNIITATSYMKGLWMECVWQSEGMFQCVVYKSMLALPGELKAARALMVLSCVMSVVAGLVFVLGMKCTDFDSRSIIKSRLAMSGGVCFICAGTLCLVTVIWTTNNVVMDFYDPFLQDGRKYEIGLCVYIGYAASCLSLIGGLVICWSSSGGSGSRRPEFHTQRSQPVSPPPAFKNIYPSVPHYNPPEELKENRAPYVTSLSSNGYRLNHYV